MQLWRSHSTAESDVWREARPPSNLYTEQLSTMCDMVWVAPQTHSGQASRRPPLDSTGAFAVRPHTGQAIRPGLDRGSCQPSPATTALLVRPGFDRALRRPSPASAGLSPSALGFHWGFRHSSPVWASFSPSISSFDGAFAVRPHTGQASGHSTRP